MISVTNHGKISAHLVPGIIVAALNSVHVNRPHVKTARLLASSPSDSSAASCGQRRQYEKHMANAKMPRPGQAAQRRRNELAQDNSDSDEYYMDDNPADGHPGGIAPLKRTRQVLPVAQLDEGWEGEVEDGATFLALAK